MKLIPGNWAKGEILEEADYQKKRRRTLELVTLSDNLVSCIHCTKPLDFSDCVCNTKMDLHEF